MGFLKIKRLEVFEALMTGPFGSLLGFSKGKVELETADGKKFTINNSLQKFGLMVVGIPHTDMRTRWRMIHKYLPIDGEIFDAGCGIGMNSLEIIDDYFSHNEYPMKYAFVTGADISKEKIATANKLYESLPITNCKFEHGDITKLKYKDSSFDNIVCSDVLEHVKDDQSAINEIARVLRKSGKAVFTFPHVNKHNTETMKEFGHVRPGYTIESFRAKAKKAGLTLTKKEAYTYSFGKASWAINSWSFKCGPLAAALFYPIYLLTFLDKLFPIGSPNGLCIVAEKI